LFFFPLARSEKDEEQKEKNMLEEIQTLILGVEK
jgi:hypothetical protein